MLSYLLVLWLAVLNALYGAFLVPLRLGTTHIPVCLVFASAGTFALGAAGGRVVGRRWGAAVPGAAWLALALVLGSSRREGDLVIPGGWVGVTYLVVGAVAAAAAYGQTYGIAATPGPPSGR